MKNFFINFLSKFILQLQHFILEDFFDFFFFVFFYKLIKPSFC